jgi:mevalonate kinase
MKDLGIVKHWNCDELESLRIQEFYSPGRSGNPRNLSPSDWTGLKHACKIPDDREHLSIEELSMVAFLFLMMSICSDIKVSGLSVEMKSQFPFAAGLGSSAAYSVCLSAGFLSLSKLVTPDPVSHGPNVEFTLPSGMEAAGKYCFSDSDLQLINKWALEGERLVHGNPSGIDNTICTRGGCVTYTKGSILPLPQVPSLRILLIHTNVPRSTKELVSGVRKRYEKYPAIFEPVFDAIGILSEQCSSLLHELADVTNIKESSDKSKADCCVSSLQTLWDVNQHLLQAIGVSHPSIDDICSITAKYGFCSKLTGAGGGGSVITLISQSQYANSNCCKQYYVMIMTHAESEDEVRVLQSSLADKGYRSQEAAIGGCGVAVHHI